MIALPVVDRSCETLVHFRCGDARCAQWWSIADFDAPPGRWGQATIFCPRCGRVHRLDSADRDGVLAA